MKTFEQWFEKNVLDKRFVQNCKHDPETCVCKIWDESLSSWKASQKATVERVLEILDKYKTVKTNQWTVPGSLISIDGAAIDEIKKEFDK